MLPIQRRQALQTYLAHHGGGTIKELSDKLGVSEMTIRRDLMKLEQEGNIIRAHGGAINANVLLGEPNLQDKQKRSIDVKDKLAAYAVEHFIEDGDVIILEGGTTVSIMAYYLKQSQLTIMTNGLQVLTQLQAEADKYTVFCSGGILREPSGTFVGPVAESFFEQFHAHTAFLSALSFHEENGFTDPNLMDTQVKKAMMESAERTVVLLDSTKYGQRSFTTVGRLDQISVLVTDSGIPMRVREACLQAGVELHIV